MSASAAWTRSRSPRCTATPISGPAPRAPSTWSSSAPSDPATIIRGRAPDPARAEPRDSPALPHPRRGVLRFVGPPGTFSLLLLGAFGGDRAAAGDHGDLWGDLLHGCPADPGEARHPHGARCTPGRRAAPGCAAGEPFLAVVGVGGGVCSRLSPATRLLSSMLYGVSATDPFTFAAVCADPGQRCTARFVPFRHAAPRGWIQ